jgi:RNA polymerase sigma-70 factor (ECF subfamily)
MPILDKQAIDLGVAGALRGDMLEPALESNDLLLRVADGDPAAARQLLDATGSVVYGFVFARVGGSQEVTEDLTQATYVEAIRSARTFRGESALETWLCAIARRQVARYFESERKRTRLERKLRLVSVESAEEADDDVFADGDALIAALGRLMPLHRQVLVLKYLDGLGVEAIADEIGRSRVQVQSLLQRARAGLKRELEDASHA